jgi:glycosyltransferase involved in cell wall biosynthesis
MNFGVSVYIPNRNHAATLGAAIYSAVREQPIEVVVIDDASTDHSVSVADAAAQAYGSVWVQHNATKAACWEEAAAREFPSLTGSHIVGLSADDELWPGIVQSVMRYPRAAVIFHPYLVRKPGQSPHAMVPMPFSHIEARTAEEAQETLMSDAHPCETGVGSAIRCDWLEWLCRLEYWRMGPWADAVGYSAVAALGGCVYAAPDVGAVFTEDDDGYGVTRRNGPEAGSLMAEVRAFLKRAQVPKPVADAICRKRGVDA